VIKFYDDLKWSEEKRDMPNSETRNKYLAAPIELTARILPHLEKTYLEITFKNTSQSEVEIFKHYNKAAIWSGVYDLETSFFFMFMNCFSSFIDNFLFFLIGKMVYQLFIGCILRRGNTYNKSHFFMLQPGN